MAQGRRTNTLKVGQTLGKGHWVTNVGTHSAMIRTQMKIGVLTSKMYKSFCLHSYKQNTLRECNIATCTNNIYARAMLSTIYMAAISCKSRYWYKNRIVSPKIENATSARVSVSLC